MARLPRLVIPGCPHLVIQRTVDRRAVVADEVDRIRLLEVLRAGTVSERVQLHAWALAENELRMVATPADPQSLKRLMQTLGRRYVATHYNPRHGRSGSLWEGRFRACVVEPGEPLLEAMAWVELAGVVSGAGSATHHSGHDPDSLICEPPAYWSLGNTPFEREAIWRDRLARGIPEHQAARIEHAARGGWAFGSAAFIQSAAASGRPATPRAPGRPRRTDAKT